MAHQDRKLINIREGFAAGVGICKLASQVSETITEEEFTLGLILAEYLDVRLWKWSVAFLVEDLDLAEVFDHVDLQL